MLLTGLAAAQPAWAGGAIRTRTVAHQAQAVFFDGECVVSVNVTESVERRLGSGKPVGGPSATVRVDSFCPEGLASATAALGTADYAFTTDSARVNAVAGEWHVALAWQASADATTYVAQADGTHTVLHDAPVTLTGSVNTIGPESLLMADLATIRSQARA